MNNRLRNKSFIARFFQVLLDLEKIYLILTNFITQIKFQLFADMIKTSASKIIGHITYTNRHDELGVTALQVQRTYLMSLPEMLGKNLLFLKLETQFQINKKRCRLWN